MEHGVSRDGAPHAAWQSLALKCATDYEVPALGRGTGPDRMSATDERRVHGVRGLRHVGRTDLSVRVGAGKVVEEQQGYRRARLAPSRLNERRTYNPERS